MTEPDRAPVAGSIEASEASALARGARKSRSPLQIAWLRLKRDRIALLGGGILIVFYFLSVFAGFFAPYSFDTQHRDATFHPPMLGQLYFQDDAGLTWPYVCEVTVQNLALKEYGQDCARKHPIRLLHRGEPYHVLWTLNSDLHLFGVDEPAVFFPFGSDQYGRGILTRLLYGSQISLSVGILGIAISMSIGLIVGGVSGYFGGRIDFVLMRIVEVVMALPGLYIILVLRDAFGADLDSTTTYAVIIVILAFIGWASNARVIRGMVLALKEQEYVLAARALGFSAWTIITRHILPNTLSFVIVTATLTVPYYILGEVALSFLGMGIQEPQASWGNMLRDAQNVRFLTDFPWIVLPGFFIFATVMAYNFVGDGLRDATDPRALK